MVYDDLDNGTVTIVSEGSAMETKVYGPNGEQLEGIKSVEIDKINADTKMITATITFLDPNLCVRVDTRGLEANFEEGVE